MFNVARKAGNARSGEYARQARAHMRSEGIACYKVLTPGSLMVGDVVEGVVEGGGGLRGIVCPPPPRFWQNRRRRPYTSLLKKIDSHLLSF